MKTENRIKELVGAINAFSKDSYYKRELLEELLKLQQEIVALTFNDVHAEHGKLRLWDVENHLEKQNIERGNIADDELKAFKNDSKAISNIIKAEFSGNAGEYKAMRSLETLRCKNRILRNIELSNGDHQTEIDMIVITERAIFIVEVKNSQRDIFIDERGNYCRVNNTMILDCNIGEKMNDKVYLLRKVLEDNNIQDINIESLVVFTNSNIQVENRYKYIDTCFLSNLPHIIESHSGYPTYSEKGISDIADLIQKAECKKAYPPEIDIFQFKLKFATLMATLENASEPDVSEPAEIITKTPKTPEIPKSSEPKPKQSKTNSDKFKNITDEVLSALGTVAIVGAGFIASKALTKVLNERR